MEGVQENNDNYVVPLCMTALSRDELHGFSSQTNQPNKKHKSVVEYEEDENGELKLNLGSMSGKLSSSNDVENVTRGRQAPLIMMRTFLMPTEGEEEWGRRKVVELMEARKQSIGNVNVLLPSSQGSNIELQRGSGFSELLRQQIEGARRIREVTNPFVPPSPPPVQVEQVPVIRACEDANELVRTTLLDMPHVTTKGPNGNKTEGLLYKYQKEDDIKIVCVCHGIFLSPAEFIKHAGGEDVEYPLRHIVVTPSPSSRS